MAVLDNFKNTLVIYKREAKGLLRPILPIPLNVDGVMVVEQSEDSIITTESVKFFDLLDARGKLRLDAEKRKEKPTYITYSNNTKQTINVKIRFQNLKTEEKAQYQLFSNYLRYASYTFKKVYFGYYSEIITGLNLLINAYNVAEFGTAVDVTLVLVTDTGEAGVGEIDSANFNPNL